MDRRTKSFLVRKYIIMLSLKKSYPVISCCILLQGISAITFATSNEISSKEKIGAHSRFKTVEEFVIDGKRDGSSDTSNLGSKFDNNVFSGDTGDWLKTHSTLIPANRNNYQHNYARIEKNLLFGTHNNMLIDDVMSNKKRLSKLGKLDVQDDVNGNKQSDKSVDFFVTSPARILLATEKSQKPKLGEKLDSLSLIKLKSNNSLNSANHIHQKRAIYRDGYGANYYQRQYDKNRLDFSRSNEKRPLPFYDHRYLTRYDYEDPINYRLRQHLGALGSTFWGDRYYYNWLRHRYPNYYLRASSKWPIWIESRPALPIANKITGRENSAPSRYAPVARPTLTEPPIDSFQKYRPRDDERHTNEQFSDKTDEKTSYQPVGASAAEREALASRWLDPELYSAINLDTNVLRSRRLWLDSENPTIVASLSNFADAPYDPEFNPYDSRYPANDIYGALPRAYWPDYSKSIEFKHNSSRSSASRSESYSESLNSGLGRCRGPFIFESKPSGLDMRERNGAMRAPACFGDNKHERAVPAILSGKFIDDISSSQIQLSAWPGNIELRDLSIKEDAFVSLHLPFQVVHGEIGKLTAIIPWSNFATSRVQLYLQDVHIYVAPHEGQRDERQCEFVKESADDSILSELDSCSEASWTYLSKNHDQDYYAEIYSSLHSIVSGVMSDMSKKIQLEVENLIIYRERSLSSDFEITIKKLSLSQPSALINLFLGNVTMLTRDSESESVATISADYIDCVFKTADDTQDLEVNGNLGSLSIASPLFYRNELKNLSADSIGFKIIKFHRDDACNMIKERDVVIELNLSSMIYVHSNLFYHVARPHIKDLFRTFNSQSKTKSSKRKSDKWSREFNALVETTIKQTTIYLIDDDIAPPVPLIELSLDNLYLWQCFNNQKKNGVLFSQIAINYYNRALSGWEPFLETCKFHLNWDISLGDKVMGVGFDHSAREVPRNNFCVNLKASQTVNINLTAALLGLYRSTLKKKLSGLRHILFETDTYSTRREALVRLSECNMVAQFILKNETGSRLHFYLCKNFMAESIESKALQCPNRWLTVDPNEDFSFSFVDEITSNNMRSFYKDLSGHKIIARVEGWRRMLPLSVDRVGRFYREACSDQISKEDTVVVFTITLDKRTARKIITVRSGLMISNQTHFIVEIFFKESNKSTYILPGDNFAVPLPCLYDMIYLRPHNACVNLSETSIEWENVKCKGEVNNSILLCNPMGRTEPSLSSYCLSDPIKLYVEVKRENFLDESKITTNGTYRTKPAHLISIKSDPDFLAPEPLRLYIAPSIEYKHPDVSYRSNGRRDLRKSPGKYNVLSGLPLKSIKPESHPNISLSFSAPAFGLSIIEESNEELMFTKFRDISAEYVCDTERNAFDLKIQDIQVDNQQLDVENPTAFAFINEGGDEKPALKIYAEKPAFDDIKSTLFRKIHVSLRDIVMNLEEKLVLQLIRFFKPNLDESSQSSVESEKVDASSFKFYVGTLRIDFSSLCLSVITASSLDLSLSNLKKRLGLEFIQFEGANIEFVPYIKKNVFSTFRAAFDSIKRFYMSELKRQAPRIIGAVDFLGNPLGLVNDLTDGLNVLFYQRDVSGLVWNVAHGLSDSTFKFSSVLSYQLGLLTMDQHHQETRIRLRKDNSSGLTTGLKKLSVGLAGGMVSLITQAYSGAFNGGVPGFIAGVGKGFVGTVTKPAVGILDFATDTARALRDMTKVEPTKPSESRSRLPRVCSTIESNLLIPYDPVQAEGQSFFLTNPYIDRESDEKFSWFGRLNHDFAIIISTKQLIFFRITSLELDESSEPVCSIKLYSIVGCEINDSAIKLTIDNSRNFTINFDDINTAKKILLSKANFEEKRYEVIPQDSEYAPTERPPQASSNEFTRSLTSSGLRDADLSACVTKHVWFPAGVANQRRYRYYTEGFIPSPMADSNEQPKREPAPRPSSSQSTYQPSQYVAPTRYTQASQSHLARHMTNLPSFYQPDQYAIPATVGYQQDPYMTGQPSHYYQSISYGPTQTSQRGSASLQPSTSRQTSVSHQASVSQPSSSIVTRQRAARQSSSLRQTPTPRQTSAAQRSPARQRTSRQQQSSPVRQQTPSQQQSPVRQKTPSQQQSPVQQQTSSQQQSPVRQKTPSQQQSPVQQQTSSQQQSPVRQQTPSQQQSPVHQLAPSQQQSPARQRMSRQQLQQQQTSVQQQTAIQLQSPMRQTSVSQQQYHQQVQYQPAPPSQTQQYQQSSSFQQYQTQTPQYTTSQQQTYYQTPTNAPQYSTASSHQYYSSTQQQPQQQQPQHQHQHRQQQQHQYQQQHHQQPQQQYSTQSYPAETYSTEFPLSEPQYPIEQYSMEQYSPYLTGTPDSYHTAQDSQTYAAQGQYVNYEPPYLDQRYQISQVPTSYQWTSETSPPTQSQVEYQHPTTSQESVQYQAEYHQLQPAASTSRRSPFDPDCPVAKRPKKEEEREPSPLPTPPLLRTPDTTRPTASSDSPPLTPNAQAAEDARIAAEEEKKKKELEVDREKLPRVTHHFAMIEENPSGNYEPVAGPSQEVSSLTRAFELDPNLINYETVDTRKWLSVLYYEYEVRLGEKFTASEKVVIVDGFTDPGSPSRFCLGKITNCSRRLQSERVRQHIGPGIQLTYDLNGGEVYIECRSSSSIFVQSQVLNIKNNNDINHITRIQTGERVVIFEDRILAEQLRSATCFEEVFALTHACKIRLSFIKGWGPGYRKVTVMQTPCWIELQLNIPLQWMEREVLSLLYVNYAILIVLLTILWIVYFGM
ncbi:Vacuolar protein sorting-associated protein 13D [Fragariocoptes setiger]|uniref:Vacuolar protein sorting-associated protein 13D n=1 Tax=Fragariocoptes setiger TaxID=1670756 RepID=A0ABQ7SCX2_9ACAR|nr:Vacuolar protein sorting-associated protein 13D [Fragariocoptes setiger]